MPDTAAPASCAAAAAASSHSDDERWQFSLAVDPLPQASTSSDGPQQQHGAHSGSTSTSTTTSSSQDPLCGAFDAETGQLALGCSAGSVSIIGFGPHGASAQRVLGWHAGRVTGVCLLPAWQQQHHAAAGADSSSGSSATTTDSSSSSSSVFATCSADSTIKLWTSNAKALHATDACLQTLRGHRAAVTCVVAVQVAHTWCLASGGSDGQVLLWRAANVSSTSCGSPAGRGLQHSEQAPGAAALAALLLRMQPSAAPLWSSPHWVLGLTCQAQPSDAGASHGIFAVLARQPLVQLHVDRHTASGALPPGSDAGAAAAVAAKSRPGTAGGGLTRTGGTASGGTQEGTALAGPGGAPRLAMPAAPGTCCCASPAVRTPTSCVSPAASQQHGPLSGALQPATSDSRSSSRSSSRIMLSASAANVATAAQREAATGTCSCSGHAGTAALAAPEAAAPRHCQALTWSRGLSLFAAVLLPRPMAVATLSYDGCARLHSLAQGGAACCWRSPTGSSYTAMAVAQALLQEQPQVLLLGDDRGCLHLYSLGSERLLATKQVARSRIAAIVCCGTTRLAGAAAGASSGASAGAAGCCLRLAVLSQQGAGLWQLRQGLSHSIVPGGHRQGVIALQACSASGALLDALPLGAALCERWAGPPRVTPAAGTEHPAADHDQPLATQAGLPAVQRPVDASGDGNAAAAADISSSNSSSSSSSSSGAGVLISAGLDGRVILWDVSGAVLAVVQCVDAAAAAGGELTAMLCLPRSGIVATGHDGGQVLLWRLDAGSHCVLGPLSHANAVSSLAPAVTAKGDELLLSAGFDGAVCLWEPRTLRGIKPHLLASFQANAGSLLSPALPRAPQQQQRQQQQQHSVQQRPGARSNGSVGLLAGSGLVAYPGMACPGRRTSLGRARTPSGRWLQPAPVVNSSSTSNESSNSGRPGSSGWRGGSAPASKPLHGAASAAVPAGRTGAVVLQAPGRPGGLEALRGAPPPEVLVVLFAPQHQAVLTGGNDGLVKVWSGCCSGQLLGVHAGHTGPVSCLALDGNLLFSGSQDRTICVWDAVPRSWLAMAAAAVAGDSSSAAGGGAGGGDVAFRVLGGGHAAAVTGLAVVPETGLLLSCGEDGQLLRWNYFTGQLLGRCCCGPQPGSEGGGRAALMCIAAASSCAATGAVGAVFAGAAGGQLLCFGACTEQPVLPTLASASRAGGGG